MRHTGHKLFRYQKLTSLEHLADLAGLAAAVILGLGMIVGLLTASGHVTW